jgi:competence protein ComEC
MITLPYVAGVLLGEVVAVSPLLLLGAAIGLVVLALFWARGRQFVLWPLLFLTGWANIAVHTAILSPHDLRNLLKPEPGIVTVRGVLRETPSLRLFEQDEKESWRTMSRLEIVALRPHHQDWRPATGRIAVTTAGILTNFFSGQVVEITGVIAPPRIAAAEGLFDYRAYLRQLGIYYQLKVASEQGWQVISSPRAPPLADRFRAWAKKTLARGLPAEDESLRLEWALTLGWKTALTDEVSEPFVRAATYHIFAVDGLRMAIIFGIFLGLFRALGFSRAVIGLALLPVLWFYVALTGWPASAIRATVMLTIIILGWALKRPSDLINSLFAAALIILVWEPQQLFQAGFQLSFFVVLCLILTVPILHNLIQRLFAPDPLLPEQLRRSWHPALRVPVVYAGDLVITSLAAWLGSLPLVAYYFNIITPISTPANVLAVPLCALVLISNFASLLLAGWLPAAAELFNHAGWALMECIRISSHWFTKWPAAYLYVPAPSLFTSALYYLLLLGVVTSWLFRPALRRVKFATIALLIAIWGWQCSQHTATTRLTILPLNGGAAVFLDAPGSKNDLLVDCGAERAVQLTTKPFLRAQGIDHLQTLLLTHGDVQQIGGAELIVRLFSVGEVGVSPVRFRSPAYRQIVDHLGQIPNKLHTLSRNDRAGPWTVLHPSAEDHFSQADDNALVLHANLRGTRVLLLSDLGRPGQNALLERNPNLRADIVVAGMPVKTEPLCDELLDVIQPRAIIVTDSEFPASQRASQKLWERLSKRGIPVIYTRPSGAATIEFGQKGWSIRTMEGLRITNRN